MGEKTIIVELGEIAIYITEIHVYLKAHRNAKFMEYFKNPSRFLISCECGNRRDSRAGIYINLHKKATVMRIVSLRKYYKMAHKV